MPKQSAEYEVVPIDDYVVPMEIIREMFKDRNLKVVAKRTGLSYFTVRRAISGSDKTTIWTIIKLSEYLIRQNKMLTTNTVDDFDVVDSE